MRCYPDTFENHSGVSLRSELQGLCLDFAEGVDERSHRVSRPGPPHDPNNYTVQGAVLDPSPVESLQITRRHLCALANFTGANSKNSSKG